MHFKFACMVLKRRIDHHAKNYNLDSLTTDPSWYTFKWENASWHTIFYGISF